MIRLKIIIFCLCWLSSAGLVLATTIDPNPTPKISIGLEKLEQTPSAKEDARTAFNHNKKILDNEYQQKLNQLGDSGKNLVERKLLIQEYNTKLKEMRKALKKSLGIKEKNFSGPPAVYTAKDQFPSTSTDYQIQRGHQKLKTFQKEPPPPKRYHRKGKYTLDAELR